MTTTAHDIRKQAAQSARTAGQVIREAGNAILDATPVPDWWTHDTTQVLNLAFPDYTLHTLLDRATDRTSRPRRGLALLRHTHDADRWLFITGDTMGFLLPLRGSTGGQWFRFKDHSTDFASGTADEILAATFARHHPDSQRPVCWWLLDLFTTIYADPSTRPAHGFTLAPSDYSPAWDALAPADQRLTDALANGTLPADAPTRAVLAVAFPHMRLVALLEDGTNRARALLRHTSDPTQWLHLWSWNDTLLDPTQPRSLRAGETVSPYTRATYGTPETLLAPERINADTFKELHALWWLLHHLGDDLVAHPYVPADRDHGMACRHEWMAHRTRLLLAETSEARDEIARHPEALLAFTSGWD